MTHMLNLGIITTVFPIHTFKLPRSIAVTTKHDMYVVCEDGIKMITKEGKEEI